MSLNVDSTNLNQIADIQNEMPEEPKKRKFKIPDAVSIIGSYLAGSYTMYFMKKKVGHAAYQNLLATDRANVELSANQSIFADAVKKSFNNSVLPSKGVSFADMDEMAEYLAKASTSKNRFVRRLNADGKRRIEYIIDGKQASFSPTNNKLVINMEKRAESAFHEMGHALNYNTKGLGRLLQKTRGLDVIWVLTFLVALFRKKKQDGEKSETVIGKGLDFIKDNCIAITAVCQLPKLLEEGLASIKGLKMAKNYLDKPQLEYLAKRSKAAWLTYLAGAATTVGLVAATNFVRNLTTTQKAEA